MKNKIGVLTKLRGDKPCFAALKRYDLHVCQLVSWNPDILETLNNLKTMLEATI